MEETQPLHDVTIEKIQPFKICEKIKVENKQLDIESKLKACS